jgi:capsular exopolysaccharide synthesis family protein
MEKLRGDPLLYSAAYLVKDQALASLREALNEGELKMRALEESYGAKHPEVVRGQAVVEDIKKKIDATLKGIQAGLQTDYEIARKSYEAIEADLSAARQSDISTHTERLLPFTKAEDELERRRQMRDSIEQRLVQERIELDLPRTPVEVIDPAEIPDENDPVSPNLLLNIILGIIVGLGAGVGLAFFIEYIDTSVKTVDDIERLVKAQILGVIPQKVRPLVEEGTESRHAEPYRVLRTNLQFSKKLGPGKAICLTSGGAGEGKSLTTFNLAFVYAQAGQKVLIVDSDLRRPTQHKMLKTVNTPGVTDVLLGKAQLADVIRHTGIPNLDFLPSGKMPSSAHGLLTIARMRELVAALKPQYDMLFFDTPPIMGVSDASIIASEVDGVLLVIQHRSYPRAVSIRAKTIVENVGGNLVGVVLNNINLNRDYYYYYYSYYYYGYGKERRSSGAREAASGPSAGAGQKAGTA